MNLADRSKNSQILFWVLAMAFVLRFAGIWYGLPGMYNSDEPFNVANALAYGAKASLEPTYFVYPAFYSYVLFAVYAMLFIGGRLTGMFESALDFGATYFLAPGSLFLTGRFLSVLLGVVTIWIVYVCGARFFSKRVGLFAASGLSLSYAHADLSHWILPEATLALMCALAIYAILRYHAQPSGAAIVVAGVLCGLAISTKYNAGFLFLPLLVMPLWHRRKDSVAAAKHFGMGVGALVIGFLVGSPYWLLAWADYWQALHYTVSHVNTGMAGHISQARFVWPLMALVRSDWSIGLLFTAALPYAIFQRSAKIWLLLLFVLPTLLFVGSWQRTGLHYVICLFPALAILTGFAVDSLFERMPSRKIRIVVIVLVCLPPFAKITLQDIRYTQPDTRTLARSWIERSIPAQSMIAYENYVYGPNLYDAHRFLRREDEGELLPPALQQRLLAEEESRTSYHLVNLRTDARLRSLMASDSANSHRVDNPYDAQLAATFLPELAALKQVGVGYVVASSDNYDRYFDSKPPEQGTLLWQSYQNGREFYASLFQSEAVTLLAEFEQGYWNLGPTLRIYKLRNNSRG